MQQAAQQITAVDVWSVVGSIASMVSLGVSIYVAIRVTAISRDFLFQARIPQLQKKIRAHIASLETLLRGLPNARQDTDAELRRCHATLTNLKEKLPKKKVRELDGALTLLGQSSTASDGYEKWVEDVRLELIYINETLEHTVKDYAWRPNQ